MILADRLGMIVNLMNQFSTQTALLTTVWMTQYLISSQQYKHSAYYRSGLLCEACKSGYSLVLGSSIYKQCTNNHLALLVPFAVMGVALVFLLLVCKLTVATRTLSGLVCQHHWSQSYCLSTSGIYRCFHIFYCMDKPGLWCWNMFLWWNGYLQQNMAAVCVPCEYFCYSRTHGSS